MVDGCVGHFLWHAACAMLHIQIVAAAPVVCLWLVCDPTPLLAVVARHPAAAGCRQRTDELRRLGSFAGRARGSCFDEPLGRTRWTPGWWAGCWRWQLLFIEGCHCAMLLASSKGCHDGRRCDDNRVDSRTEVTEGKVSTTRLTNLKILKQNKQGESRSEASYMFICSISNYRRIANSLRHNNEHDTHLKLSLLSF